MTKVNCKVGDYVSFSIGSYVERIKKFGKVKFISDKGWCTLDIDKVIKTDRNHNCYISTLAQPYRECCYVNEVNVVENNTNKERVMAS